MRRVAIVSPYFPPSTLAGVHRARMLARHLPAHGWEPVIFCVSEQQHQEALDPALAAMLPSDLRAIKCGAVNKTVTRAMGIGDLSLRGYLHIKLALTRFFETEGADALLITTGPFYTSMMGGWMKQRFGVPYILDFQDPWVSKWGATLPRWSKGGWAHWLANKMEPRAVEPADFIVSVSEGANVELRERYPYLKKERMTAIPIGGDPFDYDYLRAHPLKSGAIELNPEFVNLVYVGTALPRSGPLMKALFEAVAMLRATEPQLHDRLRITFIGTSNQPDGEKDFKVTTFAKTAGVADMVREYPARVPYLEALSLLANADGILLIGSDESHYTASKIYPALLSGTPCLGIFHAASSALSVLKEASNSLTLGFDSLMELGDKKDELARLLADLTDNSDSFPPCQHQAIFPYTANSIAGQFVDIFNWLVRDTGYNT